MSKRKESLNPAEDNSLRGGIQKGEPRVLALVSFLRTQPSPSQALDEARARPLGDLFFFVKETCQRWWFAKRIVPLYLER